MKIFNLMTTVILGAGILIPQTSCGTKNKPANTVNINTNTNSDVTREKPPVENNTHELTATEVAIDETASSDLSVLKPSVEGLRQIIEEQRISKVAVGRLGEGGKSPWADSLQAFNLPLLPMETYDAAIAERSIEQKCRVRLKCLQQRLQKMHEDFDSSQGEKMKRARTERGAKSHEIADLILVSPKGSAKCTDIVDFRDRLISDGYKRVVFYTDGDHDCATPITTKRFGSDIKVLVLQMPLKGENSGAAFAERTNKLQQIFIGEGVTIMPVVSADKDIFEKFIQ